MPFIALTGIVPTSVVIGKDWYHFRRQRFQKHSIEALAKMPGFFIAPIREATSQDIEYVESLVGSEWSLRHNCLTRLSRLWRN